MAWIKAYFDGFQIFEILVCYLVAALAFSLLADMAVHMRASLIRWIWARRRGLIAVSAILVKIRKFTPLLLGALST